MACLVHGRACGLSQWDWQAKVLSNLRDLNQLLLFSDITGLKVLSFNGRALEKRSSFEKQISVTWYLGFSLFSMSVVGSCTVWFMEIIHSHSNGWLTLLQWGGKGHLCCSPYCLWETGMIIVRVKISPYWLCLVFCVSFIFHNSCNAKIYFRILNETDNTISSPSHLWAHDIT